MEAKFKVGDVVYDSLNYPNDNGVVRNVDNGVRVYFEKNMNSVTYTCKEIKLLSFTPYELSGFTQERPWTPKCFEWIAVRNSEEEYYRIVQFQTMIGGKYRAELNEYEFAKPLTDFINENI